MNSINNPHNSPLKLQERDIGMLMDVSMQATTSVLLGAVTRMDVESLEAALDFFSKKRPDGRPSQLDNHGKFIFASVAEFHGFNSDKYRRITMPVMCLFGYPLFHKNENELKTPDMKRYAKKFFGLVKKIAANPEVDHKNVLEALLIDSCFNKEENSLKRFLKEYQAAGIDVRSWSETTNGKIEWVRNTSPLNEFQARRLQEIREALAAEHNAKAIQQARMAQETIPKGPGHFAPSGP